MLSKRLAAVAEFIPTGSRLLDVGSDHAYLPIALVQSGRIDFAVAGEVVQGPYESALTNVAQEGLDNQIRVRLANGLAALEASDGITAISICGMGGRLIAEILDKGRAQLAGVQRLILQPNNREDDLRLWLATNSFTIVAESILQENDKIYEIIVAEPGQMALTPDQTRFGVYLPQESSAIFQEKWSRELAKLDYALTQVPLEHEDQRLVLIDKISKIKEICHAS
ncbi:tRNA (adenine(22)-N(1))-methyltransferase [Streptococcus caprae]|uniref:tRNA (Adenine(22)-N(1))-methyltransferase n=1 Tax=Streptococcus caprae TaxID=1640501 RepID=A0ABV8CY57_9STRE